MSFEFMHFIGLFFGSFNPVHNGHLAIARYLLDKGYCEKVWFVVSPQNPLKEDHTLLDEQKRLEIVQEAVSGDARMGVCDIEFKMPRPSYTFQTLQTLSGKYPQFDFTLIIGGDNLRDFHLWRNYEDIVSRYRILVYPRPDVIIPDVKCQNISIVDAPLSMISSTDIRRKLQHGEDVSDWVPAKALPLILKYYRR